MSPNIDPVPPVDPDDPQKERHKLTLRNGGNGSMTVTTADGMEVADGEMVEEGTRLTVKLTADRMYLPSQLKVNGVLIGQEPDGTYCVTVTGRQNFLVSLCLMPRVCIICVWPPAVRRAAAAARYG